MTLFIFSCQSGKKAQKNANILFQKTACYGTCPIFKMTIDGSGLATYTGERFVSKVGTYSKQLSKEETESIYKAMKEIRWDTLKKEYPAHVSDLPSVILGYHFKKINKEVVVSGEHPAELDVLDQKLSAIANSDGWQSITIE
ncbi:MAG: hypothetical protein H6607_12195 [Flavobacteriales bacterium]|nr:hypothetical protein [Flavobacteriales bacterium]